ncbi:MAG: Hsp20/alpha crystallin family protein [Planctomycetota bacterium]|jgi:HSP20 family molecular chaperone IbpA
MTPANSFSRIWNVSPATLDELRREFDEAVDSVSRSVRGTAATQLPLAAWEDDQQVILELEVPGVAQEDLDIVVEAGVLTVTGKRRSPERTSNTRHNEHRYGEFQRRIRLDESLDPATIAAELENGVLTLTITRRLESQPVRVTVRTKAATDTEPQDETHVDQ